jgi:type IV pilus assembly protein PilY1
MDLVAADFDLDYSVEALYFGTVKDPGSPSVEFTGSLYKVDTGESASPASWQIRQVHDTARAISIRPSVSVDDEGERFVYVGTGRLLSPLDAGSTTVQRIYGVRDKSLNPVTPGSLPVTGLVDVTNVVVNPDGTVGSQTFEEYLDSLDSAGGWFRNLEGPSSTGGSERVVSNQAVSSGLLITPTYRPSTDLCSSLGTGRLFVLNYEAGVASPAMAGVTGGSGGGGGIPTNFELGPGVPSAPTLSFGQGEGRNTLQACIQTSTGAIICQDLPYEADNRSGEISWRQPSED